MVYKQCDRIKVRKDSLEDGFVKLVFQEGAGRVYANYSYNSFDH